MKSISKTDGSLLITGSSGFIGNHLCSELKRVHRRAPETVAADVLDRPALQKLAQRWSVSTVIHLAGSGRVVAPVSIAPAMFSTAIQGTLNVVDAFVPSALILASTCAVYGTTGDDGAIAGETRTNPIGLYGHSRTSCERLATNWATETGNSAIVVRFGNVIGPGCGGLIPYLVDHAVRYPDASVPARLRGGGLIIRDYVPVSHLVRLLVIVAGQSWDGVTERFFNLGTGRGKTNGEVARRVADIMARQGYKLKVEFTPEAGFGEALQANLDVRPTTDAFGIRPPDEDEVQDAIASAVYIRLNQQSAPLSMAAAQ